MSNEYRNTSYDSPYNGGVPYQGAGSIGASDDFSNSRPQLTDQDGAPLPGWAGFDEKWKVWDPGQSIAFAGVDTRIQMGVVRVQGKNISGMYQALPIPVALGEAVSCVLYGQLSFGYADAIPVSTAQIGPCFAGLLLGDDFAGAPSTSGGKLLGMYFAKQADTEPQVASQIGIVAADFFSFDAGMAGFHGIIEASALYVRYRIRQTLQDATPTYLTEIRTEWSIDGAGWLPLYQYPQATGPAPLKSAGFGVYAGAGASVTLNVDQWSLVLQDYKDPGSLIGGVQVLGSV